VLCACPGLETPQRFAVATTTSNGTEMDEYDYPRVLEPTTPVSGANRPAAAASAASRDNYYDGYEIPIPYEIAPLPPRAPPPRAKAYENIAAVR